MFITLNLNSKLILKCNMLVKNTLKKILIISKEKDHIKCWSIDEGNIQSSGKTGKIAAWDSV